MKKPPQFSDLFPISSPCTVGDSIDGLITGIMLRDGGRILYEVSWWDGNTHICKMLETCEVSCKTNKRLTVGFTNGQRQ